jgi:hypothetical protein
METQRQGYIRTGLILAAIALLFLTAGFFMRLAWATNLWPWADTRLSYIFASSILVAISIPILGSAQPASSVQPPRKAPRARMSRALP